MEFVFIAVLSSAFTDAHSASLATSANIATSIPFLVIGVFALRKLCADWRRLDRAPDLPLLTFAFSLVLVGAGSAFYHWSPSTYHLLWDRLPIALCLAALVCAMANVYAGSRVGTFMLAPAILVAVLSVLYWYGSWTHGHEDLRPYAAVQLCATLWAGAVAFRRPTRLADMRGLRWAMAAYASGRILELFQQRIYDQLGMDLGHPLKHLLVAIAAFLVIRSLYPATVSGPEIPALQLETVSPD